MKAVIYDSQFKRMNGLLNAMPKDEFDRIVPLWFTPYARKQLHLFHDGKRCPFFNTDMSARELSCHFEVWTSRIYAAQEKLIDSLSVDWFILGGWLDVLLQGNWSATHQEYYAYFVEKFKRHPWAIEYIQGFSKTRTQDVVVQNNTTKESSMSVELYPTQFKRQAAFLQAMPKEEFVKLVAPAFTLYTLNRYNIDYHEGDYCQFFDPKYSAEQLSKLLNTSQASVYVAREKALRAVLHQNAELVQPLNDVLFGVATYGEHVKLKDILDQSPWAVEYIQKLTTIDSTKMDNEVSSLEEKIEQAQTWIEEAPVIVQTTKVIEIHKAVGICSICLGDVHIKDDLYVCDLCRTTKPIESAKPIIEMGAPSNFMEARFSMRN